MNGNDILEFEENNFETLIDEFVRTHEELRQYKGSDSVIIDKCYNHPEWNNYVAEEYVTRGGY